MSNSRIIAITGCSRGLGRALTDAFIQAGHSVAGCARSPEQVQELARNHPSGHYFKVADTSDDASVAAWTEGLLATVGVPDLIINNAAMTNQPATLWNVPTDEFMQLVNINIVGVHRVIRHLLPPMIAQGRGVVVNLSSGWGRSVAPEVAPYCTSKWAIEGLSQALAQELPSGLAAVALSPGVIDTSMLREVWGAQAGHYKTPAEWVVQAAPYILGLNASHNGQSLTTPG